MGIEHKRTGSFPRSVWTLQDSRQLGQAVVAAVVERVHRRGENVEDKPFDDYSTRPLAFDYRHPLVVRVGKAMFKRAGKPMYGNPDKPFQGNPAKAYVWAKDRKPRQTKRARARRKARTEAGAPPVTVEVGRLLDGGYKQLQEKGRGAPRKQLILTGELERSWRVKDVSLTLVVVGMTGDAARYGTHLNRSSHSGNFAGLSPKDRALVLKAFRALLRARMAAVRGRPAGGGA